MVLEREIGSKLRASSCLLAGAAQHPRPRRFGWSPRSLEIKVGVESALQHAQLVDRSDFAALGLSFGWTEKCALRNPPAPRSVSARNRTIASGGISCCGRSTTNFTKLPDEYTSLTRPSSRAQGMCQITRL